MASAKCFGFERSSGPSAPTPRPASPASPSSPSILRAANVSKEPGGIKGKAELLEEEATEVSKEEATVKVSEEPGTEVLEEPTAAPTEGQATVVIGVTGVTGEVIEVGVTNDAEGPSQNLLCLESEVMVEKA